MDRGLHVPFFPDDYYKTFYTSMTMDSQAGGAAMERGMVFSRQNPPCAIRAH
jgi:hypothetical protein